MKKSSKLTPHGLYTVQTLFHLYVDIKKSQYLLYKYLMIRSKDETEIPGKNHACYKVTKRIAFKQTQKCNSWTLTIPTSLIVTNVSWSQFKIYLDLLPYITILFSKRFKKQLK